MVVDAAKSEEIKACGIDSVNALGRLSLQRKIESVLLETGVLSPHLFVTVEDMDQVRLFGVAGSAEENRLQSLSQGRYSPRLGRCRGGWQYGAQGPAPWW